MDLNHTTINEENPKDTEAVSLLNWVITLIISAIPLLNFLMWLVWAFDRSVPLSKRNWAKAMLIITIISLIISFLFLGAIFGSFFALFNELNNVQMEN